MKIVAVFLSSILTLVAGADEYRDAVRRFSITLPLGWFKVGDADIKKIDELSALLKDRNFRYVAAFTKDLKNPLVPPFIVIQETNIRLKGNNYDGVEKMFNAVDTSKETRDAGTKISDIPSEINADGWIVDRARNRMTMNFSMTDARGEIIKGVSTGYFGEEVIIQINNYVPESQFAKYSPEFEAINDSFRFDRGVEFRPISPTSKAAERAGAIGQLIGIVLGLVIGIIVYRKFKRAPLHA